MAEDTRARTHAAIDQLVTAGVRPSVAAVARTAGVARSTIYRHPELMEALNAARGRLQAIETTAQLTPTRRADDARHRDEIARLRRGLDQLAQTVQALTLDNERLRRELADNDRSVTPLHPVSTRPRRRE